MEDSIEMVGRRISEDVGTTTWKRQKHMVLDENDQELLIVSRRKACQEDTGCVSRTYMNLTVAELERTLDISMDIFIKSYPEEFCEVRISSYM